MASRLGVYHNMNALGLCRPRMASTRFIRPALFWRTMFAGGPTLRGEINSTLGEEAKSALVGQVNQETWEVCFPYRSMMDAAN